MSPTLLRAVTRKVEAIIPDADLLARYLREHDNAAFEELVRRHGPLVWSVCRQMLPHHADAEDAFQAVFLALVRSAARIRDGRTVPAWLHGVAVRIATRAKRDFARRRARERAVAATSEVDHSVADEAWESLAALVHEEIQQLPEAERTAFVLCDLQGVSQADAASRLGWPLGSVSGRLCKARRWLLERLAARGVAPAAFASIGLTSGAATAVPESMFNMVKTFSRVPGTASTAATALAKSFVEGMTMRVKLMIVAAVVFAAMSVTGGAAWLAQADAQPPKPVKPLQPPKPPEPPEPPEPPKPPKAGFFRVEQFTAPGWEYKFVDTKADRKDFEKIITQYGKEGWEFAGSERFDRNEITLVFKKHTGGFGGVGGFGGGGFAVGGLHTAQPGTPAQVNWPDTGKPFSENSGFWGRWGDHRDGVEVRSFTLQNGEVTFVIKELNQAFPKVLKAAIPNTNPQERNRFLIVADAAAMKDIHKLIADLDAKGAKPEPAKVKPGVAPRFGGELQPGPKPVGGIQVRTLKNAQAGEIAEVLKKLFPNADIEGYALGNALLIRADAKTLAELEAIIAKLDVQVAKPR